MNPAAPFILGALALAHQRLAEEERRAGEARVLAARLVEKVQSLTQEIESLGGRRRVVGESKSWKDVLKQATAVAGDRKATALSWFSLGGNIGIAVGILLVILAPAINHVPGTGN